MTNLYKKLGTAGSNLQPDGSPTSICPSTTLQSYLKLLRKFEFEIQFLNLLGKSSGFLGHRGNRKSRALSGFFLIREPKIWLPQNWL
jgi:hypothetical protein